MSLLDDENILIERVKLSIKDTVIAFLQHNYLNELVEYLDHVMPVKDYQWKIIESTYAGSKMVTLVDSVITVCQLKSTSISEKPVMFFNPLSKYRLDKIEILNKLDIKYRSDSDFEIESAYFLL
jgi:hypothetical protein